jgi:malonyl-CoA decarboxylase
MDQEKNKGKEKSLAAFSRTAIRDISRAWDRLVGLTRRTVTGRLDADLSGDDYTQVVRMISGCIHDRGGEISSREKAVELGKLYLNLSQKGRGKFMSILAREFDVHLEEIEKVRKKYPDPGNDENRIRMEIELAEALVPPRVKLLKQFISLPNGFKFLIEFRADLLFLCGTDPYLHKLDADLKAILSSWFDVGFMDLKSITWESPASLLEKLIEYEAVHAIQSWDDLKNRLVSDRQCFAFFHNKVPNEPLIFLEVALVNHISDNIQKLLDTGAETIDPEDADTAIFYSISNAQKGLAGINLGNFLIKRVVEELQNRLKNLKHFATLSPVPRFREWLDPILLEGDETILTRPEIELWRKATQNQNAARGLLEVLNSNWQKNEGLSAVLKSVMMRLCAGYLISQKKNNKAIDPVANFHLTNGARIHRLNWLGDISEKGMKESAGIMVNYYYKLSEIEKNHEHYLSGYRIQVSKDVRKWL